MMVEQGRIRKGIGGFYYVETALGIFECKARGVFRKEGISPLPGDMVEISLQDSEKKLGTIEKISPRKNVLVRPPVANIDQLVLVSSICEPAPNLFVLDKMLAIAADANIEPVLIFSKTDLQSPEEIAATYKKAGFFVLCVSSETQEGVAAVEELLKGKFSVFTGNSGVGKSSLLNSLNLGLALETGEISHKLGRGRHTTRQVELFPLECGGYVADTPGFSSVRIEQNHFIRKENLAACFPEFEPYVGNCRFQSCSHVCEKGCAVRQALQQGEIAPSRYENYVAMYQEVKDIKEWKKK